MHHHVHHPLIRKQNMLTYQLLIDGGTHDLERAKRFELSTFSLATRCSTTELRPLNRVKYNILINSIKEKQKNYLSQCFFIKLFIFSDI